MMKRRLSEERTRRLQELRTKYPKLGPGPEPPPLTLEDIKRWLWQEQIGYQLRGEDYWRVTQGEAELTNGDVVTLWLVEETDLPLRDELLDHCPPLDTPPEGWLNSGVTLA